MGFVINAVDFKAAGHHYYGYGYHYNYGYNTTNS